MIPKLEANFVRAQKGAPGDLLLTVKAYRMAQMSATQEISDHQYIFYFFDGYQSIRQWKLVILFVSIHPAFRHFNGPTLAITFTSIR